MSEHKPCAGRVHVQHLLKWVNIEMDLMSESERNEMKRDIEAAKKYLKG